MRLVFDPRVGLKGFITSLKNIAIVNDILNPIPYGVDKSDCFYV